MKRAEDRADECATLYGWASLTSARERGAEVVTRDRLALVRAIKRRAPAGLYNQAAFRVLLDGVRKSIRKAAK